MTNDTMTAQEMLDALHRLHRPYIPTYVDVDTPRYGGMCWHCSVEIARNSLAIAHPCPTLLAVDPEAREHRPEYWRYYSGDEPRRERWGDDLSHVI